MVQFLWNAAEICRLHVGCILQIMMARSVLASDMAQLVQKMRLAKEYSTTVLDTEYRKNMLQAAHVLAKDSKNLLDSVDHGRRIAIFRQRLAAAWAIADMHRWVLGEFL